MKIMNVEQADALVSKDDRYWWETYAKTLVHYTPGRGTTMFKTNGYFNRNWNRGKGRWGTIKRYEIDNDGRFYL